MKEIRKLFDNNNEDYNFEIKDRYSFENVFKKLLGVMKFTLYGYPSEFTENDKYLGDDTINKIYEIFTIDEEKRLYGVKDVFFLHPYNWDFDVDDEYPNFYYYPRKIGIQWYKYALRDAYCNKEIITLKEFNEIIDNCIKEVKKIIPEWLLKIETNMR